MPIHAAFKLALVVAAFSQVALFGAAWLATGGCFCAVTGVGPPPTPAEALARRLVPVLLPANAPAGHLLRRAERLFEAADPLLQRGSGQIGDWGTVLVFGAINTFAWAAILVGPLAGVGWLLRRVARQPAGAA